MTLKEFLGKFDFVKTNKVFDLIDSEEYNYNCWKFFKSKDEKPCEVFDYRVTSMNNDEVEYFHNTYNLNFIFCKTLDTWVWVNDIGGDLSLENVLI